MTDLLAVFEMLTDTEKLADFDDTHGLIIGGVLSPPVGAVCNRTEQGQLETVPTKRENGRYGFLTPPVWRVQLIEGCA